IDSISSSSFSTPSGYTLGYSKATSFGCSGENGHGKWIETLLLTHQIDDGLSVVIFLHHVRPLATCPLQLAAYDARFHEYAWNFVDLLQVVADIKFSHSAGHFERTRQDDQFNGKLKSAT